MSDFSKLKVKKNSKEYILNACTQDTEQNITGTKNFTKLTVNSKNVVTSINGVSASEDGNVTISASSVEESWINDYNGYRVYSDGFCEQWGYFNNSEDYPIISVSLYKAYKNTYYNLNTAYRMKDISATGGSNWPIGARTSVHSITTTSFKACISYAGDSSLKLGCYWRTWGYIR